MRLFEFFFKQPELLAPAARFRVHKVKTLWLSQSNACYLAWSVFLTVVVTFVQHTIMKLAPETVI
jgi:hypothetical protein